MAAMINAGSLALLDSGSVSGLCSCGWAFER